MLHIKDVSHSFVSGEDTLNILRNCNLEIKAGEIIALVGASGAGKTTFLQIAGLLEKPVSGDIVVNGISTFALNDNMRTKLRLDFFGFVYQFHHLLPEFNALENVIMPSLIKLEKYKHAKEKAEHLLSSLKLSHRLFHYPKQLSGGEQQRVAIARALANKPKILLADEPTGNLDPVTSKAVFDMFLDMARKENISVLIATHNLELASFADRKITIENAMIVEK